MTLPRRLVDTALIDLQRLVDEGIREGPHLEFKRALPSAWTNEAKHEFVADVTAFANAGGGDLVYGIDEGDQAQASAIVPQELPSSDQETRRLQDFLLNLVEPRIPGTEVHAVPVTVADVTGYCVLVRVPQSWAGPHRVRTNQHFYVRDGLRKRQLDVPEIRSLFLRSDSQSQRIRDFRTENLGRIMSGEAPLRLVDGPLLVVHLVPTQAALGLVQVDPVPYTTQSRLPLIGASDGVARLNLDGALAVRNVNATGETHGYSQFFRNGFFEATCVLARSDQQGLTNLPSVAYERNLIALFGSFRRELARLGISLDCAVLVSLMRADEVRLGVRDDWGFLENHQTHFDRRTLVLPDVLAPADATPEQALKPVFDLVWQAAGFSGSRNYNDAGNWEPQT